MYLLCHLIEAHRFGGEMAHWGSPWQPSGYPQPITGSRAIRMHRVLTSHVTYESPGRCKDGLRSKPAMQRKMHAALSLGHFANYFLYSNKKNESGNKEDSRKGSQERLVYIIQGGMKI